MLLSNDRVRLRALEPEDLELLYRWENDPELWEVGNTLAPYSRYILKEYIAGSDRSIYESRQLRFMIEECDTGTCVGIVDLFDFEPHPNRAACGIMLDGSVKTIDGIRLYVFEASSTLCAYSRGERA